MSGKKERIHNLRVDRIHPNLRLCYPEESIENLCRLIRLHKQTEPIRVILDGEVFKIIDGEQRVRACKKLRITHVKAIVETISS